MFLWSSRWFRRRSRKPKSRDFGPSLRLEHLEQRLAPAATHFAVIGDYGSAGPQEASVAALVKSWNPDVVLTVGDNNYETGLASTIDANIGQYYHDYIGNYSGSYGAGSAVNRFFPTLGNHDWQTRSGTPALPTPYLDYFTLPGNERYYTFTQGPVQFFAIDSGDGSGTGSDSFEPDGYTISTIQGQWLENQLAASTAQWKLVYFHHSPFSSGALGNNDLMQWPFQAWGATAVITGHDHDYERLNIGGFPYFVDGLGGEPPEPFTFGTPVVGSQVHYNADNGALRVDATDTGIQFQFITPSGAVIDSYTIGSSSSLPTVTIAATDATAAEPGTDTGTFTVTRTGSTAAALTVNLTVGGTATNGIDYTTIANSVTIPAGSATATVQVTPLDDLLAESNETAILTLASSATYTVGAANSATVTIVDNDSSATTLVAAGSAWKYLDNGSDQGTAWRAGSFNDGTWASGNAELGYGDGDEATVVGYGPDANNKYITTYFRRAFAVTNAAAVTALQLRLLRDDGAVVYLNGVEVFRSNMNAGAVSYNSLAPLSLGAPDESTFVSAVLSPGALITGTNVLAVEIHQASPSSSDISFNLELVATLGTAPAPTADVVDVTPDPRTSSVGQITITFSGAVSGFDLADLKLTRDGGTNLLTGSQTLTTGNNITWTLGNLSGLTGSLGVYTLTLSAAGSGIKDAAGNALAADASDAWQVVPVPAQIIDDGATGFATVGSWKITTGQGFQADIHSNNAGTGSKTATWTFTGLTSGRYRVSATWTASTNRATNSPFTVLQGGTVLATVAVNQRLAPSGFTDAGGTWQDLGGPYQITGTSLVVRLTDKANGVVVADAVRIELLPPVQTAAVARTAVKAVAVTAVASPSNTGVDGVAPATIARWLAGAAVNAFAVPCPWVSLPASVDQRPPAISVSQAASVPGFSSEQEVRRSRLVDAILEWLAETEKAIAARGKSTAASDLMWVQVLETTLQLRKFE